MTCAERPAGEEQRLGGVKADLLRWRTLVVLAVAQVTVVIDLTIVNVALPEAQTALHMSDTSRQWVVTAYALTFGSLLLLGGRIADYWGRKRSFIVGMLGFAAASALAGTATSPLQLFGARALQGMFGALLAPAALSLVHVNFPSGPERTRAFAVFGAIAGGGGALGFVLGGVLTEYANWRWCFYVNLPVALITSLAAVSTVRESRAHGESRYDIPGAIAAMAAVACVVFGLASAATGGWTAARTVGSLISGAAIAVAFLLIERASSHPLLPLHIVLRQPRGGSLLIALLASASILGTMLFLTYYLQITLGYSPLRSGVALLPMTMMFALGTRAAELLTNRFGLKILMVTGGLLSVLGIITLTTVGISSAFASHILPSQIVLGVGLVLLFIPLSNAALHGVEEDDAGAAGAVLNATQQIGSAVGVAIFTTIYATASAGYLKHHQNLIDGLHLAQLHGYIAAFWVAAAVMLAAALVAFAVVRMPTGVLSAPESNETML